MRLRVQEIHPTIVHFPLAFFPLALAFDWIGKRTRSRGMMEVGKALMPVTLASMGAAAVTGLAAQGAVKTEGRAKDMLITHRNLNIGLMVAAVAMTTLRMGRRRPSTGYLLAGAGALAGMAYSAYLGGKMVYEYGVGVMPAGTVDERLAPEIGATNLREAAGAAAEATATAVKQTVQATKDGQFAPELRNRG